MLSRSISALFDPIRQSQGHAATSPSGLIRHAFAVQGAPRRPLRPSGLSLPHFPSVPQTLPRWGRRPAPVAFGRRYQTSSVRQRVVPHIACLSRLFPTGCCFRGCIFRFMLRPAGSPRPPDRVLRTLSSPLLARGFAAAYWGAG